MIATAKVFSTGNSQAVRLPKAFRVTVEEMWIARNEVTGEITLKPKDTEKLRRQRLDALMAAIAENPMPSSFLSDTSRQNDSPRNPFEDWADTPAKSSLTLSVKPPEKRPTKIKERT